MNPLCVKPEVSQWRQVYRMCFFSVIKSTNMLHLIWTDIQSVVQFKNPITAEDQAFVGLHVLLHINVYDWVLHCVTLHAKSPFFACSRRCALPLAWTESNSLSLSSNAQRRMNIWPRKSAENWPESFSSTLILVDFSDCMAIADVQCARACLCMPKCLCV